MNLIEHFVGGKIIAGSSKRIGKIFNPATGDQSSEVKLASKNDIDLAISTAKKAFINGERNAEKLLEIARKIIETTHLKIDYLECVDFESFQIVNKIEKSVFIAVAVFLGDVRLIDNEILEISYFF